MNPKVKTLARTKTAKKVQKKKVVKKATKKGVTKKATKKVAKKKVSKKVAKKATKKVKAKAQKLTPEAKLFIKEQKELKKQLDEEFATSDFTGSLNIGLKKDGNLLIKKESDNDQVNEILNDILKAFEVSLAAKELAPVFSQAILKSNHLQ